MFHALFMAGKKPKTTKKTKTKKTSSKSKTKTKGRLQRSQKKIATVNKSRY